MQKRCAKTSAKARRNNQKSELQQKSQRHFAIKIAKAFCNKNRKGRAQEKSQRPGAIKIGTHQRTPAPQSLRDHSNATIQYNRNTKLKFYIPGTPLPSRRDNPYTHTHIAPITTSTDTANAKRHHRSRNRKPALPRQRKPLTETQTRSGNTAAQRQRTRKTIAPPSSPLSPFLSSSSLSLSPSSSRSLRFLFNHLFLRRVASAERRCKACMSICLYV